MKLFIQSFGCQMNVADAEEMARPLLAKGFQPTTEIQSADAILINTCTVRQHAEDRAISLIGRLRAWKNQNPERFLIVAGCAAERTKDWLKKKFPYVDLVAGARSIEQFPELLKEAMGSRFDFIQETRESFSENCADSPSPVRSFVTAMRGCNYSCTYCIVPAVRGREIYRPPETILQEVHEKVAQGTKEVMLVGQTVNSYRYQGVDFADLLRLVNQVWGVERIRFTSPHPFYLNDRMIQAMAECDKVCEHLHLPVQSGSNRILKLMRRNYTHEGYLKKVAKLRKAVPEITLSTDFIVGFPAETEEDFQETLRLQGEVDFSSAFCFKFSPRQGTEAATMDGQVDQAVREDRLARLLEAVEERARKHLKAQVGKRVELLIEEPGIGRTRNHFKVKVESPLPPGALAHVLISSMTKSGQLTGHPIGQTTESLSQPCLCSPT